jgi:hypothetical protein
MLEQLKEKYHKHLINFHKVLKLNDIEEIFGSDGTFRCVIPLLELCIEQVDRNMILKNNSEIMVMSFSDSIIRFLALTKDEITASNIHHMNALLTSIDLVTKFGNEFVLSVNSALDQFQTLKIGPEEPRSSKFAESQVSFVLDAINALKEELEGFKSSFKFYDEMVRGQTTIVVEKLNLAFGSFQTQLTENLFKRFGDF